MSDLAYAFINQGIGIAMGLLAARLVQNRKPRP
jgi:uncharacterized membrane-anchored protein YhcB (DUF1043 family)